MHDNYHSQNDMNKDLEAAGAMDCLVAVGRIQSSIEKPLG